MQWLKDVVSEVQKSYPEGDLIVSSGVSPSGKYHIGTLREVLTADAVMLALRKIGRKVRHIHFVDDLDGLRKVPAGVDESFSKYLGQAVCDVPAPDGSGSSYADYFLSDFIDNVDKLGIDMEVVRSHEKYRQGYFVPSIEKALGNIQKARESLEQISGRKLGEEWSPIQVNEDGYLKKRPFISIDTDSKTLKYKDVEGVEQVKSYALGDVKLDWRLDWPARWWQLGVSVEPFGRDHATKGGSYDTGKDLVEKVFGGVAPIPVPYQFINCAGENKKMSKSAGNTVTISELLEVLPAEIVRYFILRSSPDKQLFFDTGVGVIQLFDEYAELLAKNEKSEDEQMLVELVSTDSEHQKVVSKIPFSHIVSSYQAALKDPEETLAILARTEHSETVRADEETLKSELKYVDKWLKNWAPEDAKFELANNLPADLTEQESAFLKTLGGKVASAPPDADGEYFHKLIYEVKDEQNLEPKFMFSTLYKALIGKTSGPRAGWFLSILPREWLVKRLKLEA